MKNLSKLISIFLTLVKCEFTENGEEYYTATAGILEGASFRNNVDMKTMMHMKVCRKTKNCAFKKDDFFNALKDYGCNCYPSKNKEVSSIHSGKTWYHMAANGHPINSMDKLCLTVHNSYRCMHLDDEMQLISQKGNNGCYKGIMYNYHFDKNGNIICGTQNNVEYQKRDDDCRLAACKIERDFALKALEIMEYDPLSFKNKNINNYNSCSSDSGNGGNSNGNSGGGRKPTEVECCGEYPERTPFNNFLMECKNGKVVSIGSI